MSNKRSLMIRICAVLALILIAACMMVIGRGHTVYLDNKTLEYGGQTYTAPYKVTVTVKGEQVAKLYAKERGSADNVGQRFEMTLKVMQEKNGDETTATYQVKLPYKMDGVVINLPGYFAGLPEEAWLSEFVSLIPEPSAEDGEVPSADEFEMDLGDEF
ncbi:MAG: hypothetical protein K6F56_09655 [Oscillospiraceae bacterium]|nr:hypothetical protein [Oscillospiraceae bacterium]